MTVVGSSYGTGAYRPSCFVCRCVMRHVPCWLCHCYPCSHRPPRLHDYFTFTSPSPYLSVRSHVPPTPGELSSVDFHRLSTEPTTLPHTYLYLPGQVSTRMSGFDFSRTSSRTSSLLWAPITNCLSYQAVPFLHDGRCRHSTQGIMSNKVVVPPKPVWVRVQVYGHDSLGPKRKDLPDFKLRVRVCQTTMLKRVAEDVCSASNRGQGQASWRIGKVVDPDGMEYAPGETVWGALHFLPLCIMKAPPATELEVSRPSPQPESKPVKFTSSPTNVGLEESPRPELNSSEIVEAPPATTSLGPPPQPESSPMELMSSPTNMVAAASRAIASIGAANIIDLTVDDSDSDPSTHTRPTAASREKLQLFQSTSGGRSTARFVKGQGVGASTTRTLNVKPWKPGITARQGRLRLTLSSSTAPDKPVCIDLTTIDESDEDDDLQTVRAATNARLSRPQGSVSVAKGRPVELRATVGYGEEAMTVHEPVSLAKDGDEPVAKRQKTRNEETMQLSKALHTDMSNQSKDRVNPTPMMPPARIKSLKGQGSKTADLDEERILSEASRICGDRPEWDVDEVDSRLWAARQEANRQSSATRVERAKRGLLPTLSGRSNVGADKGKCRDRGQDAACGDDQMQLDRPVDADMPPRTHVSQRGDEEAQQVTGKGPSLGAAAFRVRQKKWRRKGRQLIARKGGSA